MATRRAAPAREWPPVSYWLKVTAGVIALIALAKAAIILRQILILLGVSMILAIGFQPTINWFERKGWKRGQAVALMTFISFAIIGGFLALVVPQIIKQIGQLAANAPDYIRRAQKVKFFADLNTKYNLTDKVNQAAAKLPSTAFSLIKSFTAFLFNALTVMILTLYFTTAMPKIRAGISKLLRPKERERFEAIIEESTIRVGGYIIGNIVISIIAGVLATVALLIMRVPYAAALGFWVALTDLIPTVGAILGAAAAVIVALFSGIPQTIGAVVYFLVYQQVENYVIAPRVMKRAVQMSAAAVIVALLIGGSLAGFVGALLALPAAAIVTITARTLYLEERAEVVAAEDAAT